MHAASFDLAGPFLPGCSFDPVASGRDRGLGYRCFVACAFTIPLAGKVSDRALTEADEERAASSAEPPPEVELVEEGGPGVSAVRFRFRSKGPESPDR